MSNSTPVPRMFLPSRPRARACSMARSRMSRDPGELAADVDEAELGADGVAGDGHALDQQVRVVLHDLPVLERARLALVGVADQVDRLAASLGRKPHFTPAGKPAPPRPRRFAALTSATTLCGRHAERRLEGLVAAAPDGRRRCRWRSACRGGPAARCTASRSGPRPAGPASRPGAGWPAARRSRSAVMLS